MAAAPFLDECLRQLQFWVTEYSLEEMSGTDIQADFCVLPRSWTATEETLCGLSVKITVKDHIGMGNGACSLVISPWGWMPDRSPRVHT